MPDTPQFLAALRAGAFAVERSAGSFATMDESGLRTALRVALEGRLAGSSAAEALHARGKTDILVRVGNTVHLVVECKIWRGGAAVVPAIDQLLGYTTWRDRNVALVFFVRTAQIQEVLSSARVATGRHPRFSRWLDPNPDHEDLLARIDSPSGTELEVSVIFVHLPQLHLRGLAESRARKSVGRNTHALQESRDHRPAREGSARRFLDPIHGYILATPSEVDVLSHPTVQRLREIAELPFVSLTYPAATHTRLEAAVGRLGMATRALAAVAVNSTGPQPPTKLESAITRLAALLLHVADVSYEPQLGPALPPPSIPRDRLMGALFHDPCVESDFESLGALIDEQYGELTSASSASIPPSQLVIEVLDPAGAIGIGDVRLGVCRDLIAAPIGATRMDALVRGSHHVGLPTVVETDRLLQRLTLGRFEGSDRVALSVGNPTVRADALSNLISLAVAWIQFAERVAEHQTVRAAEAMFQRAVAELALLPIWPDTAEAMRFSAADRGDARALSKLDEIARAHYDDSAGRAAAQLLEALARRQLHSPLQTVLVSGGDHGTRPTVDFASTLRDIAALRDVELRLNLPLASLSVARPSPAAASFESQLVSLDGELTTAADLAAGHAYLDLSAVAARRAQSQVLAFGSAELTTDSRTYAADELRFLLEQTA